MKKINDIFAGKHRRGLLLVLICGIYTLSVWGVDASYYSSANGKSDANLRDALYSITSSGPSGMSYDKLWTAYKTTDVYPSGHTNAGKIWDMYSNCSFTPTSDQCGNYSNICDCYNREHSLPKSWFNDATPMYYDLGHIVPTDGKVNSYRSNFPFGEVNSGNTYSISKLGSAKSITTSNTIVNTSGSTTQTCASTVFEPADDYKGDFARMYMYMRVRYYNTNFTQDGSYGKYHFSTTYTKAGYYGLTAYSVALLMKWHRQDPVSQKEIDRNNAMQTVQGNRNPFIDYPCLAEYLWGEHTGETFSTSTSIGSFESSFTPGSSDGCSSGGGSSTTNYTLTWKVNGTTSSTTTSSGSSVGSVPSAPSAPSACSDKVFVGWSTTNIGSTATNTAPSVLFTDASGAPSISGNTTFFAVFATSSSGGGTSNITFDLSTLSSFTTSGGAAFSATSYGITFAGTKGMYASGPQMRVYTGSTITISASSTITAISFTANSSYPASNLSTTTGTYTGSTTSGSWSGSATSVTFSASAQCRITALSVTIGGGTTYSAYVTTCSASSSCTAAPTVGAASAGDVTTTTATATCSNGITKLGTGSCTISSYGFVYGTTSNPTLTNGTAVQVGTSYTSTNTAFSTALTGLSASTTYYVRPYATNDYGTGYGSQASFTTKTPTSYTVTWKVNGSTYTTGSPTTSVVEGNKVTTLPATPSAPGTCSDYTFVGWSQTNIGSAGSTTAPSDLFTTAAGSPAISSTTVFYAVYSATSGSGTSSVTDNITLTTTGVSGTTYTAWSGKTVSSDAVYAGQSAGGNNAIQLRSNNNNSGIITTGSGGTASKITVTWNSNTSNGRTINVYGKNTAYSNASDLYNNTSQGTLIGTIVKGTSTELTVSGSYTYIGLRSNSGALYLDNVAITWGGSGSTTTYYTECVASNYTITVNAETGGTASGSGTYVNGSTQTISATPAECYTFKQWNDGNTNATRTITVSGNATYTATFEKISYTVTANSANTTQGTVTVTGL